jgi:3-deoxy-D-arabino-heptulosonate 7-phosphate (DAHP) synthase
MSNGSFHKEGYIITSAGWDNRLLTIVGPCGKAATPALPAKLYP